MNFNGRICIDNIYFLAKEKDVKIGDLESKVGVSPGYLSRLNKEDNNTKPGIDFLAATASFFGVSIETLISIDLSLATPTKRYIITFIEKLIKDTDTDKLDWRYESNDTLNNLDLNNGWHPLFSQETFMEESECEYPNEVTRIVFNSKSYGCKTAINGECYNLRLKNGAKLYLMNICKSVHRTDDLSAYCKELWMVSGNGQEKQFIGGTLDDDVLVDLINTLYASAYKASKQPKINSDFQNAINAFMNDDLEDDPISDILDGDIPF